MKIFLENLYHSDCYFLPIRDNQQDLVGVELITHFSSEFRMLSLTEQHSAASPLRDEFIDRAAFDDWFARYRGRLQQDEVSDSERQQLMQSVNPALVLRNWLAQRAIEAAEKGDMTELHRLHEALRNPFSDRADDYVSRPPDWGKRLEVSCSS